VGLFEEYYCGRKYALEGIAHWMDGAEKLVATAKPVDRPVPAGKTIQATSVR